MIVVKIELHSAVNGSVEDAEAFRRRFDETRDPAPTGP